MDPLKRLSMEIVSWIDAFCGSIPGIVGFRIRSWWLQVRGARVKGTVGLGRHCTVTNPPGVQIGAGVFIGDRCTLTAEGGELSIGDNCSFNMNVFVGADFGKIRIGNGVLVAMNVVMRAANHRTDGSPEMTIRSQGHVALPIYVGNDVWIGANVVLLPGARIGDHCVIGAGAVVVGEIPSCSVAVGVPAKVVKSLGRRGESIEEAGR